MPESVYKVIELIGTSKESWEKAATAAVSRAGKSLRDLRVAEVVQLDLQLDAKGKVEAYRAKLKVSFKFEELPRPRLRGERARKIRGGVRFHHFRERRRAPSPQPSPREGRGEGEDGVP